MKYLVIYLICHLSDYLQTIMLMMPPCVFSVQNQSETPKLFPVDIRFVGRASIKLSGHILLVLAARS